MKLLLCSWGPGKTTHLETTFRDLLSKPPNENRLFILSTDTASEKFQQYIADAMTWYRRIGFTENNIAVYNLISDSVPSMRALDVLHIFGGNTFLYLKQIRETGLIPKIRAFIDRNGVYVGTSAGTQIMCPDIDENLMKSANDVGLDDICGFGYVDFYTVVHWGSNEILSGDLMKSFITYSWKTGKRIVTLTDQQAILVLDDGWQII